MREERNRGNYKSVSRESIEMGMEGWITISTERDFVWMTCNLYDGTSFEKIRRRERKRKEERVEKNDEGIINRISVKKTSITFFLLFFFSFSSHLFMTLSFFFLSYFFPPFCIFFSLSSFTSPRMIPFPSLFFSYSNYLFKSQQKFWRKKKEEEEEMYLSQLSHFDSEQVKVISILLLSLSFLFLSFSFSFSFLPSQPPLTW